MVVQHNLTAMNANRMLGITTNSQAKSTEKLSSGYRINRAADDAAGLSISEKMRKQIRGLTKASSNAQDGISSVQTAEGALTEVTDMLQRMNELAVQAANSTNSESDRKNIQDEIDQLITEIDRVAETTKFNETYLLKGDKNGTKGMDYSYKTQAMIANTDLYKVGTDGSVSTVAAGSVLDATATYYTEKAVVGEKVSVTSSKVGAEIATTALITAGFSTSIAVFNTTGYYLLSGTSYVEVEKGAEYDSAATYYTLTTNSGGIVEYKAAVSTQLSAATATGYKAVTTIYDANGNAVASGDVIDTTATYYSSLSDANTSKYSEKVQVINTVGLYVKTGTEFKAVASGAEFDTTATYYKLDSVTGGGVTYSAVATNDIATVTGYKAASGQTLYDSNGQTVAAGTMLDPSANYYSNIIKDTVVGKVTDLSKVSKEAGTQLCDKDGNEIAANGLYRYFKEDGTYDNTVNGGLFIKDGDELKKASDKEVDAYVQKGEAAMGKLKLSFHVGADATKENQITIELESMNASVLGIKDVKVTGEDDKNALDAIETIAAALSKVSSQRSGLGAIQNRLEHTIANLDNIVENTTSAESQIRDTDMATEMVNYSKNNILAQAGQSMLAQANQSNQGVLSLLG